MNPAIFVGDALGLDFLNSVATPLDTPVDWIKNGEGLLDWVEQARLAPPEALDSVRSHALPGELDKVADQARHLREWFRGFVREHKGRPLAAQDLAQLEPLNRLLERDEIFTRIAPIFPGKDLVLAGKDMPGGNAIPLQLQTARKWRTPETLLLPIGEALARFVCSEDFSHVKACEGPACTLLFTDHTRGHRRRWCSMAQCGNRAKQAAHRHRIKAHHD